MKDMMTPAELAEYLDTTVGTLAQWRYRGEGPRYVKAGRLIRYRAEAVHEWMDANTRQGCADDAA